MGKFSQDKKSIVLIKSLVSFLSLKRYCPFLRNGFTSLKVAESLLGSTFLTTLELSSVYKKKNITSFHIPAYPIRDLLGVGFRKCIVKIWVNGKILENPKELSL